MSITPTSPQLFDRTWRCSCPIRPRHSRLRRWGCLGLLALLTTLIVGYAFLTDANRVRDQAENYLARLVGGPVTVDRATLSLFEGLRLEDVTVHVPADDALGSAEDDVLFTARSVKIDYDPLRLLLGKLSATRVVAVDPRVNVVEDVVNDAWNFQRLERRKGGGKFNPPDELPEILLRNAQMDYRRRFGEALILRGSVGIEAQLTPAISDGGEQPQAYRFAVQTRGLAGDEGDPGPRAGGMIDLHNGRLEARLADVDFAALLDILPRAAGDWWRRHGIAGRLDVPQIKLDWDRPVELVTPEGVERVPSFRVQVELEDATIQGLPEEWLPPEEIAARQALVTGLTRTREWLAETQRLSPGVESVIGEAIDQLILRPIRLQHVEGSFVFSESGLRIAGLTGDLEGNRLRVDGIVGGYHRDASLSLVVRNDDESLTIAEEVPYIASLPRQVRELYERFSPVGEARLRLELHRPAAQHGEQTRPIVTGSVEVLDSMFTLDRFPYPIRNARGRLVLRYDRENRQDQLLIENLTGNGAAGGPNAEARITVNGIVAPLNSVAGFDIMVAGRNVNDEPALIAALPEPAREAIRQFDPADHGRGNSPDGSAPPALHYGGDFLAHVSRPPGRGQQWDFRVDLMLRGLSGALAEFPYPIQGADADLTIFPDGVQIKRAHLQAVGDGTFRRGPIGLSGRIDWGRRPSDPAGGERSPLRVDLTVTGNDVPAGPGLLGALPDSVVEQVRDLGLGGRADLSARVFSNADGRLAWDVTLDLEDGRFWPASGTFSLSDITGRLRVLPDRVMLSDVVGRRGDGSITADGTIGFGEDADATLALAGNDVTLDAALYELLPAPARDAWDWIRPTGTTDFTAAIEAPVAVLAGKVAPGEADVNFDVALRPDKTSVLAMGFPYPLTASGGEVRVTPGKVEITDLTARPSDETVAATLTLSGTGTLATADGEADVWDLRPSFTDLPVDETLLTALPDGLAELLRGASAGGRASGTFEKLKLMTRPAPEGTADASPPDVEFDIDLGFADAQTDVGVPLTKINGRAEIEGAYRNGKIDSVAGSFDASSFLASGRSGSELHGEFAMAEGSDTLTVSELSADLTGGRLGGQVQVIYPSADAPADDASSYRVELSVRDADVRRLMGEADNGEDFGGNLTARLDLEGRFADATSRRGRGEVLVEGRKLYDLPLVLGLLQVTNLALPIAEPFDEATAAFTIDGQRVVFDRIELAADEMRMNGQGSLDFGTEKVNLMFTTSNHGWASIPLLGDIVGLARNELLRVHVRGTLQKPQVSGSSFPTVTSTIDEVFRSQ